MQHVTERLKVRSVHAHENITSKLDRLVVKVAVLWSQIAWRIWRIFESKV